MWRCIITVRLLDNYDFHDVYHHFHHDDNYGSDHHFHHARNYLDNIGRRYFDNFHHIRNWYFDNFHYIRRRFFEYVYSTCHRSCSFAPTM